MVNKVLSIDSSSSSSGWALYINGKYSRSGVIDLKKNKNSDDRIKTMTLYLQSLITSYSPTVVVTEETVVLRNPASQRILTMILGVIYGKCVELGIEYLALRPTEWRKLVDPGKKPRKRDELKEWSKVKV